MAEGVTTAEFIRALAGRDLIPPIDDPRFLSVGEVNFLADAEPVIAVEIGGQWRAYPIQILIWHEIVNDRFEGQPITVTFCPLCYTSVVFDRRVDGEELDFGVTGYLRRSDLVMYDRQTETWWQQASGRALMGDLVGHTLTILSSQLTSWAAFRAGHPEAAVLSRDTGNERPYGSNPYPGWDDTVRNPFLGPGQLEPCKGVGSCIDPKERVGVLTEGGESVVYRFQVLAEAGGLAHDTVGGTPVVVRWLPDVTSALDNALLERSHQVGTVVALDRTVGAAELTFVLRDGALVDEQTGSTWDEFGRAVRGPLAGEQLRRLVLDTPYWFAAAAFATDLDIWAP
ncbi:MAG: DUF3179 domain-containing protein [Candidatus Limnocylindria bacterium]